MQNSISIELLITTHRQTKRERERERFTEDFISSFLAKNKFIQTSTALKQN
jgi:hypothetical protein